MKDNNEKLRQQKEIKETQFWKQDLRLLKGNFGTKDEEDIEKPCRRIRK